MGFDFLLVQPQAFIEKKKPRLRRKDWTSLRWEDLDIQNRTLSVNKSVARQNGKLVISTPKTPNSIRNAI